MTTKVTKESLAENIGRLEEHQRICREYNAELSINQEYQLKAYRLLIDLLPAEELRCPFCQFVVDESDFEDHECAACGAYLE